MKLLIGQSWTTTQNKQDSKLIKIQQIQVNKQVGNGKGQKKRIMTRVINI